MSGGANESADFRGNDHIGPGFLTAFPAEGKQLARSERGASGPQNHGESCSSGPSSLERRPIPDPRAWRIHFFVYFQSVIRSFADTTTETIFLGGDLSRKEARRLGNLDRTKAFERLAILNEADEKTLLLAPFLHYHKLKGSSRYSIDADSRKSPWRITFQWENSEMKDVQLVKIEDTH